MALVIVLSVGAPLCLVVVILGCLNCFMKRKPGFSPFANPNFAEEGSAGRNNDAFAVDMEPTITTPSNESHVTMEPIPDVAPKVVSLPPLRPKILSAEKDSQNASLNFFSSHRPFPRENLTYLNPLGVGWFGQVIQSEALRISTGSMRSQVVVKMLKDDASSIEENRFIDEILPFRHLDHPNVISLLGQCTESRPYLYIVEYAPHGDLKTFLQSYKQDMGALLKKNRLLHFCLDAAAGIACIHRHNFVHCDLSTRNCLVMSDYKIKIGDYGFAEQSFKEDYFQSENELLPIRWMAPECLIMKEGGNSWTSQNYSKASDMWSFGVLMWEMFSMAEQPYDMLTDEAVLQGVVIDKVVSLADIPLRVPFHDRLSALMSDCWKDPAERTSIESAHQILDEMSKEKVERVADELDFDQKWNHLIPNTQSRSQSLASEDGSAVALAGSFSSGTPSNIDDKPSPAPLAMERETSLSSQPNIDEPVNDVFPNPISLNAQSDLSLGETIPDQALSTENVAEVDSVLPNIITPSKKPLKQMTSTPLADKSVQNKTPSFITAPNTPNSQYITAEEGSTADGSVIESGSASQVDETQGFDSLTSSEGDKTVQESEIETPGNSVKDDSSLNNGIKEESSSQIGHAFDDFVSFNSDSNASQDNIEKLNGFEVESSKPHELDASFDIIVPSMLDKDQNSETTSQQAQMPSSSQNASHDFMTDFTENDVKSFAVDKNVLSVTGQEHQVDFAENELDKCAPHNASNDRSFESGALQSSASNPFNSFNTNPFSPGETTSPSIQDAAIFFDKSEIDASSSLNSSSLLGGWDTSFAESHEPAKDAADKAEQANNLLPFAGSTEGQKEDSPSDFSFVEAVPVVSDTGAIDTTPAISDSVNNTTTESLLSGFEPPASSNVNAAPSSLSSQIDDMFGSLPPATTAQPSPFFNDEGTKPATVETSDPFDFSAFEINNIPNAPEMQQKPAAEIDIFSSGFNEFSKADNGQEQKSAPSTASDFPVLDIFSSDSSPAATNPESAGLMLGGDLLTSVPASGDNQVGTRTVYKCDDINSLPEQSEEEEESGVINSCHSLTESNSTFPTATASTSDSCYVSGMISDFRNVEEVSSSEDISSRAFALGDTSDGVREVDFDHVDHCSNSTEAEESSSCNSDVERGANSVKSSNSEDFNSSEETSSTSGSEREYICVNPFDTGQPPTTFDLDLDDKENLDPVYGDKDISFDDLNEQDLKIVSEIYLSKGMKSPRVFEVPTLETIPEHQPLHCVSEDTIPTPSETSSIGPRDDELFGSDSYEWDDFYGNSLIGKDDTGPDMEEEIRQSPIGGDQNNISNWSLDFEADSSHYSSNASSSVLSTATLNRSDSSCIAGNNSDNNSSLISDHKVQSLSDSELFISKNSTTAAIPCSSLVASTLAKHRNRSLQFSSPLKNSSRDNGNFYSLMEDFDDFQLDSSQEEICSPVNLSDDDEFAFATDKQFQLAHVSHTMSSSFFSHNSSSSPVLPATFLNSSSHASALSPKKSTEVLAIDKDAMKESKVSSTSNVNSTSSPPTDLLGLGFDPVTSAQKDMSSMEQSLDGGLTIGNSLVVTSTTEANDPFDSLI